MRRGRVGVEGHHFRCRFELLKGINGSMKDLDAAMQGIEFRRSQVLLDEIPSAYKDIDEVMENAKSLVETADKEHGFRLHVAQSPRLGAIFVAVLALGLLYAWRKGVLKWA